MSRMTPAARAWIGVIAVCLAFAPDRADAQTVFENHHNSAFTGYTPNPFLDSYSSDYVALWQAGVYGGFVSGTAQGVPVTLQGANLRPAGWQVSYEVRLSKWYEGYYINGEWGEPTFVPGHWEGWDIPVSHFDNNQITVAIPPEIAGDTSGTWEFWIRQTSIEEVCYTDPDNPFNSGCYSRAPTYQFIWVGAGLADTPNLAFSLAVVADPDGDGTGPTDNCQDIPNSDQADADNDGIGDACDEPLFSIIPVEEADACLPTPLLMDGSTAGVQNWWVKADATGGVAMTLYAHAVNPDDSEQIFADVYRDSGAPVAVAQASYGVPLGNPYEVASSRVFFSGAAFERYRIELTTTSSSTAQRHYWLKFEGAVMAGTQTPSSPSFEGRNELSPPMPEPPLGWKFNVRSSEPDLNIRVFTAGVSVDALGLSQMEFTYELRDPSGSPVMSGTEAGPLPPDFDFVISYPGAYPGTWTLAVVRSTHHYRLQKQGGRDTAVYLTADSVPQGDRDGDGIGDLCDDSDGDRISDATDRCPDVADNQADADRNGVGDACEACADADNDGVCDDADVCSGGDDHADADGDGLADACDACPADALNDQDGDGFCSNDDICPDDVNNDQDGDGLCSSDDLCPNDVNNDQDGDGICGDMDACPNGDDRVDTDGDSVPDACDPDDDNDGVFDTADLCLATLAGTPVDAAGCPEQDGDGIVDTADNCPLAANPDQANADHDGDGDVCDPDDDNDGFTDAVDNCPLAANGDQADADHDGRGAACDDEVPPTITAPPAVTVYTGPGADICAAPTSDAALGTASASDNEPGVIVSRSGVPAGNLFPLGITTIVYTATDAAGNTATASQIVTVIDNTVPIIAAPAPISLIEGTPTPGSFSATASDNCPGVIVTSSPPLPATFAVGTHGVTFTATDGAGNTAGASSTVTVIPRNRPPTVISTGGPYSVTEGSSIFVAASAGDPDGDPLAYIWDLDGNGIFETPGQTVPFSAAGLDGPSLRAVTVMVSDPNGLFATAPAVVSVLSAAPTITDTPGPQAPVLIDTPAAVTINYTDPGLPDSFTCTFDWTNDGSVDATVSVAAGIGSCTANHVYTAAGVYTVGVSVTDDDGGSASSTFEYVVVYGGSGFVTGGGGISSPAGVFSANSAVAGRAHFGFNAKYDNNRLKGETEFQLKDKDEKVKLNFQSTSYDWLLVTGPMALYVGSGTINKTGDYAFLVSVIDGKLLGTKIDRFRIRIWDKATGDVIYDNEPGADPYDAATFATEKGNIVIH